jgi:FHS family L-fucose permease-like MFS transporter
MARRRYLIGLIFLTFFVMSVLTNILGPIVPDIIAAFRVNLGAAGFLVFAFFIAYGVMSIPAGFLVQRFSEKPVMIWAFVAATVGSLSFALFPRYPVAMVSLFVIGGGMAALQVAINPLLRVAGGSEHLAFNSAVAQLVFGAGSFLSPRLYSYLVLNLNRSTAQSNGLLRVLHRLTPAPLPWVSLYWLFSVFSLLMILISWVSRFPTVPQTEDERPGTIQMYRSLASQNTVWLYFVAIFAYLGCEQGTSDWISRFLSQYHGFDPHTTGALAVSWFWGLLSAGCFLGMFLLKLFDSRRVLVGASAGALLSLTGALFGPASLAILALPLVGLFVSVMYPIVFSLALNSVKEYHGALAGILSTGIVGGAIVPLIIGRLGDQFGLRAGLMLLYVTFGIVGSVGFWAKPLINNATLGAKTAEAAMTP